MRFGIMAMQIDSLIPAEARLLPPDQAIARILGFDHSGLVRQLASQGFDPIELGGDLSMLLPHTYSAAAIEKLAEVKAELVLALPCTCRYGQSSHLRFCCPSGRVLSRSWWT